MVSRPRPSGKNVFHFLPAFFESSVVASIREQAEYGLDHLCPAWPDMSQITHDLHPCASQRLGRRLIVELFTEQSESSLLDGGNQLVIVWTFLVQSLSCHTLVDVDIFRKCAPFRVGGWDHAQYIVQLLAIGEEGTEDIFQMLIPRFRCQTKEVCV